MEHLHDIFSAHFDTKEQGIRNSINLIRSMRILSMVARPMDRFYVKQQMVRGEFVENQC